MANENRKGAVLSDKTALKEYGVTRDLIVKGIQTGKLEYREGAVWGNPSGLFSSLIFDDGFEIPAGADV